MPFRLRHPAPLTTFLRKIADRKVLVFVFFLLLSGLMWMMISLNEDMEKDFAVPIRIVGVSKNVVITGGSNDTLRLTLHDKGYTLANYYYGKGLKPIEINFQQYADNNGMFTISGSDLQRMVKQQLSPSTRITGMKPDKVEVFFNHGNHKTVPIRFQGSLTPSASYVITQTRLHPDRATVYAADGLLDSIHAVYTASVNRTDIADSALISVRLLPIRGAKIVPDRVNVSVKADMLTEKTVEVPITVAHLPEDKHLRLFPSTVKVKFVVATGRFASVSASDFTVVADYQELLNSETDKVRIHLRRHPKFVEQVKTDVSEVGYLIEDR